MAVSFSELSCVLWCLILIIVNIAFFAIHHAATVDSNAPAAPVVDRNTQIYDRVTMARVSYRNSARCTFNGY